jgi:sec-independent protein translocase protein TatA
MVGDILQPTHLLFILVVALLVLGPKRLPEVGRSLGNGLRDFKAAIDGQSHDDHHTPSGYVETESETETETETEPAGLDLDAQESAEPEAAAIEPATPTALHEQHLDPDAIGDDLEAPEAVEDLHAPAARDDLQAAEDLHAPAAGELHTDDDRHTPGATDEDIEADREPATVAAASSNGFASALASSRQRPADGGESTADDE